MHSEAKTTIPLLTVNVWRLILLIGNIIPPVLPVWFISLSEWFGKAIQAHLCDARGKRHHTFRRKLFIMLILNKKNNKSSCSYCTVHHALSLQIKADILSDYHSIRLFVDLTSTRAMFKKIILKPFVCMHVVPKGIKTKWTQGGVYKGCWVNKFKFHMGILSHESSCRAQTLLTLSPQQQRRLSGRIYSEGTGFDESSPTKKVCGLKPLSCWSDFMSYPPPLTYRFWGLTSEHETMDYWVCSSVSKRPGHLITLLHWSICRSHHWLYHTDPVLDQRSLLQRLKHVFLFWFVFRTDLNSLICRPNH